MGEHQRRNVVALTADHTVAFPGDAGALFTNEGASDIVITLPASADPLRGAWVEVYATDNAAIQVKTATVDTLMQDGDIASDSVEWKTPDHMIGNGAVFTCTGTKWLMQAMPAVTTTTPATWTLNT